MHQVDRHRTTQTEDDTDTKMGRNKAGGTERQRRAIHFFFKIANRKGGDAGTTERERERDTHTHTHTQTDNGQGSRLAGRMAEKFPPWTHVLLKTVSGYQRSVFSRT